MNYGTTTKPGGKIPEQSNCYVIQKYSISLKPAENLGNVCLHNMGIHGNTR